MDGIINAWHDALGFPDGGRSRLPSGRLRVEARDRNGRSVLWTQQRGTGLGNLELEAHQALLGPDDAARFRAALVARLSLPSATGPFAGAGSAAGLQLVLARPLGKRHDVYLGFGTTFSSRRELDGVQYRRTRPQAFAAIEARPTRWWSIVVQVDAASRLVTNVEDYPGGVAYLRVGSKFGLRGGWTIEGGITEGVRNIVAATDFGIVAGVSRAF